MKQFWPYVSLIGVPALGSLIISGIMQNSVGITVEWLWPYLLVALVMSQLSVVLFSLKFSEIIALYDAKMGLLRSCKIAFVSTFYYFALPAAIGVELSRFLRLRSAEPRLSQWQAVMILLLDRVFGLAGAVLLLGAGIWLKLDDLNWMNVLRYDGSSISVIAVIAAVLLIASFVIFHKNKERLSQILQMIWRRKLKMFMILGISTSYHFLLVISVWFALIGLGIEINVVDLILAICGGMVFMIVPLSLAGVSLAELGAAAILIFLGTEYKIAELVAFLFYLTKVIPALQGALIEFLDNSQIIKNRFKR